MTTAEKKKLCELRSGKDMRRAGTVQGERPRVWPGCDVSHEPCSLTRSAKSLGGQ